MEIYNENVKKKIMFNKDSDYYFITYNSILILDRLNCYENESNFYDYRKLIYILPFISNDYLLNIAIEGRKLNNEQIKSLEDVYINAKLREPILKSILFTLDKKGYLTLKKNTPRNSIDVQLIKETLPEDFLRSDLFRIEEQNIELFKKQYKRLAFIKFENLIDKLFKDKGVLIWDV